MGTNWGAGLMRWRPHVHSVSNTTYSLSHLHPFQFNLQMAETPKFKPLDVKIFVGFSMHTFTRGEDPGDDPTWRYHDKRETRIFDLDRYKLSKCLPDVVRTLDRRKCFHAKNQNFLTLGQPEGVPAGQEYQVFFDLRRGRAGRGDQSVPAVELIVQSAYAAPYGRAPRGRRRQPVGFRVLINGALDGRMPHPSF